VNVTWSQLPSGLWTSRYDGTAYANIDVALASLATTTKGTWMTWVKLDDATPVAACYIVAFGDTDADESIYIRIDTTGKVSAKLTSGGVVKWSLTSDNAIMADGINSHICLIHDGISPILLINGVEVAITFSVEVDKTLWFSSCSGLDNGRLGCLNTNTLGNLGFINNGNTALTKFYTYVLTQGQIINIYENEKTLFGYR